MKKLFLTSIAAEVMDDIITHLSIAPKELNLAFIPTASEVETGDLWWLRQDREKLEKLGFNITEFSITGMNYQQVRKKLENIDVIFVSGGNTFYLLDQAIKSGFDKVLQEIEDNLIYIGSSAGSALVGNGIGKLDNLDDKSKAPDLKSDGLKLIDLAILPHWGSQEFKEGYKESFESLYKENYKIILITNHQYLFVEGETYKLIQV